MPCWSQGGQLGIVLVGRAFLQTHHLESHQGRHPACSASEDLENKFLTSDNVFLAQEEEDDFGAEM